MSLINTSVPPFALHGYRRKAGEAGKFVEVSQDTLKDRWSVLVFYPADFTFVCPTELEDLAEHQAEFDQLNVDVYSVSTDTHFTHKAWHDHSSAIGKITYTMLADPTGKLTRALGVMIEEEGLALRGTFLINPEGKIQAYEIHDNSIGRDASELLRKIKAAQYVAAHPGEVCPAKWHEGDATLTPSLDLVGKI
jgi:NADH-dependent peroxiredoxin subunit C